MPALRKSEISRFLLDHLVPLLEDKGWLLLAEEGLVKVRDETLFGFHAYRSDSMPSFVFQVFIRPLYWPPAAYAYGITQRIGDWCRAREGIGEGWVDLGSHEAHDEAARRLAPIINSRVAPYLDQFADSRAVLRYRQRRLFDPMLGIVQFGRSCGEDLFAYMWAWTGDLRKARSALKGAIAEVRHETTRVQREISRLRGRHPSSERDDRDQMEWAADRNQSLQQLEQLLSLLEQPEALRSMLQENADRNRLLLKLDRARPA